MRLHDQVKHQNDLIETYETGILEIRQYLSSPKFYDDSSVNIADIFLRLDEMRADILRIDIR